MVDSGNDAQRRRANYGGDLGRTLLGVVPLARVVLDVRRMQRDGDSKPQR